MSTTAPSTEDYGAFLEALRASPVMRPYVHALRVLTDPRTKAERIRAAVEENLGALRHLPERSITSALQKRLAWKLRETSLAEVPCDKAIRGYVRAYLKKSGVSPPKVPHRACASVQACTIAST